jgi:hypothetical protein
MCNHTLQAVERLVVFPPQDPVSTLRLAHVELFECKFQQRQNLGILRGGIAKSFVKRLAILWLDVKAQASHLRRLADDLADFDKRGWRQMVGSGALSEFGRTG